MQGTGKTEEKRFFDDIREMIGKRYRGDGVWHLKAVERVIGEKTELNCDAAEYETLRLAYECGKFPEDEVYPVDVFCDPIEEKTVKIIERNSFYKVYFYNNLKFLNTDFNTDDEEESCTIFAFPKCGCEIMEIVDGHFEPACFWTTSLLTRNNDRYRLIFTDVMERMGEIYYIYRDIARSIRRCGYFVSHEPISRMKEYRTPNDLVRGLTKTKLNINFNKRDLNYSLLICVLSDHICERDWGILCGIPEEKILGELLSYWKCIWREDVLFAAYFLCDYFDNKFGSYDIGIWDWETIIHSGDRVSLRLSSVNKLKKRCEEIRHLRRLRYRQYMSEPDIPDELVSEDSVFKILKDKLPQSFEWITSLKRLKAEGENQHNCVYTYWKSVLDDECAILHWEGAMRYTIEVRVDEDGCFCVEQMKGPCNSEPETADELYVTELIETIVAARE